MKRFILGEGMVATIKDVAGLAGVSLGTVSKVINGDQSVSDKRSERVKVAIATLGYSPNSIAQNLRTANSKTISVLLANITNPFQMALAKGIEEVAVEHNYNLAVSSTNERVEKELDSLEMFERNRSDGIIICSTGKTKEKICSLIEKNIPVVMVDRFVPGIPCDYVGDNFPRAIEIALQHLQALGHNRIGIIHGDMNTYHGAYRHGLVLKKMRKLGLPHDTNLHKTGPYTYEQGGNAFRELMAMSVPPTAVLAVNNVLCAGAINAANNSEVNIPGDVSLVLINENNFMWDIVSPGITMVTQSPLTIGRSAANIIFERLRGKEKMAFTNTLFEPTLVVRESTRIL
ncbi:LacI family DNA-binding transcriptional regulator [Acerihabitans sp.]|uniref:LacI family DNA-binding transcriptional regulator n=1 Tax=Acerihabitans sp. TaxID=2811394 RepID=UPI002EDB2224